ncbi:MAG: hypothetical protein DRH49_00015 [Candidatus Coatesbacteria bacterium]|nr:MAG: hypothetical protein DRH49_00015 [Candidatus Coatesbacteria bacterium]
MMKVYYILDELASEIQSALPWVDIFNARSLVIVSKTLSRNRIAEFIWRFRVPQFLNIKIMSPEQVPIMSLKRDIEERTLIIFESLEDIIELIYRGMPLKQLYIARMPDIGTRKQLMEKVNISPLDYQKLLLLRQTGTKIFLDPIRRISMLQIEGLIREILFG